MSLYDCLTRHYRSNNAAVLRLPSGENWTLDRLERCAVRCQAELKAQGVGPGDRVLVQVAKSPECIALYLCCLRSGFVFVPLNTAYTTEELSYFVQDADPAVVVVDDTTRSSLETAVPVVQLSTLVKADSTEQSDCASWSEKLEKYRELPTVEHDDLACIVYTSGTTGRSKGAALSHANLLANGLALSKAWGFSSDDVLLHALPVYHVHGLFIALHTALLSGARIRFLAGFDVDEVVRALPDCTVMMGVPTYYARLLSASEFAGRQVAQVRLFISGSAPLSMELFDAFRKRTGHDILERYGMSETNVIASNPLRGERLSGTVGYAVEGVQLRVADHQDRALPHGQTGSVQVRGSSVFAGYWRKPEITQREFTSDGYFRTGDLGQLDDGGRLTLNGRSKDLIITGGLNVYPAEIERFLDAHPGVLESAVVGVADADFGERVEAFIVSDGSDDHLDEKVVATARRELANFKRPKAIHLIESLPRNTMGKVQKNVLRERLSPD